MRSARRRQRARQRADRTSASATSRSNRQGPAGRPAVCPRRAAARSTAAVHVHIRHGHVGEPGPQVRSPCHRLADDTASDTRNPIRRAIAVCSLACPPGSARSCCCGPSPGGAVRGAGPAPLSPAPGDWFHEHVRLSGEAAPRRDDGFRAGVGGSTSPTTRTARALAASVAGGGMTLSRRLRSSPSPDAAIGPAGGVPPCTCACFHGSRTHSPPAGRIPPTFGSFPLRLYVADKPADRDAARLPIPDVEPVPTRCPHD